MTEDVLIFIDDYGLLGSNFYWRTYKAKGLTKDDVLAAGLTSGRVQVSQDILKLLVLIDAELQTKGYRLYIKEGYRSKTLYEIIYKRRVEKFGQEETDRILNMKDMPHSNGLSVDVALWGTDTNTEVYMRNWEDGIDALFVDFYSGKAGEESKHYQQLQEDLIGLMQQHGFRLGTKREYFHFDYRPDTPRNYPIS